MNRYTCSPGYYSAESTADLKKGINLFCGCIRCGTQESPKGFIVNLDFTKSWIIPKMLKAAKCPDCSGTAR
jgi:hypothetical protein